MNAGLDLTAYLTRVSYSGSRTADIETLRALHRAHAISVPFENLDIQMGRPIHLDLASLQDKIVRCSRGGYCFEQNTLFDSVLEACGFEVTACEARVRHNAGGEIRPRTHMVLVVRLGDDDWLADVGFGSDGPLEPVLLDGEEHLQHGRHLRTVLEGADLVLQARWGNQWEDLYGFVPDARYPVDFEVSNWYTSTFPDSVFVKTLTAQRTLEHERHVLRNLTYTIRHGDRHETREIARDALIPLLHERFGIDLPETSRFRALDGSPS
jgi:N-hydroxyarylamine O-acetyltransferase